ncbi:MAG: RNA pseudouridine synthase, partial [Deltaproteobacteria bacterium]
LAARDEDAYGLLREMFGGGLVEKTYLALAKGRIGHFRRVEVPLGSRYRRSRKVFPARSGRRLRGVRPAVTEVVPLAQGTDCTLCRVVIRTGVRHQIRAHLSLIGHPIWGDVLYGGPREQNLPEGAFMLHAFSIALDLPWAGPFEQRCQPPGCFVDVLRGLGVTLEQDFYKQMKE